jgi:hypothetical protein
MLAKMRTYVQRSVQYVYSLYLYEQNEYAMGVRMWRLRAGASRTRFDRVVPLDRCDAACDAARLCAFVMPRAADIFSSRPHHVCNVSQLRLVEGPHVLILTLILIILAFLTVIVNCGDSSSPATQL